MIKKGLIVLCGIAVIALLLGVAAVRSVKPTETLDWSYEPVSIARLVGDMVRERKLEVLLTERDLNNLLKERLSAHRRVRPEATLTGARFEQQGDELIAFVNLLYINRIEIGAKLHFTLEWRAPDLAATHIRTEAGRWTIPPEWFRLDPIVISIDDSALPLVKVRDVVFLEEGIAIRLGRK